jgi:hypothetical protein
MQTLKHWRLERAAMPLKTISRGCILISLLPTNLKAPTHFQAKRCGIIRRL